MTQGMFSYAAGLPTSRLNGKAANFDELIDASAGNIIYVAPDTKKLGDGGSPNDASKAPAGKTYNGSYDALAERSINTGSMSNDLNDLFTKNQAAGNKNAGDNNAGAAINWAKVKKMINARTVQFNKDIKAARASLVDAVKQYNWVAKDNATSQVSKEGESGAIRISGKNRYQTSAYLSVFQSKSDKGKPDMFTGEGRFNNMKSVYLASGDSAHLIDPVFAGMVKDGTILLVPTTGEVDTLVATELERKGKTPRKAAILKEGIRDTAVWAVGGKAAISDDVFQAAVNAMFAK